MQKGVRSYMVKKGSQHTTNVTTITAIVLAAFCSLECPASLLLTAGSLVWNEGESY